MRFLADMCVDVRIARWLQEKGHDATHLRDEGLHRMPNGEVFQKAINENRVVLTFDLDFGEIAALTKGRKVSVILFRLRNTRTPHVIDRLSVNNQIISSRNVHICFMGHPRIHMRYWI
jgi:predicted nuclease of predicted toxin-antitoxin system